MVRARLFYKNCIQLQFSPLTNVIPISVDEVLSLRLLVGIVWVESNPTHSNPGCCGGVFFLIIERMQSTDYDTTVFLFH